MELFFKKSHRPTLHLDNIEFVGEVLDAQATPYQLNVALCKSPRRRGGWSGHVCVYNEGFYTSFEGPVVWQAPFIKKRQRVGNKHVELDHSTFLIQCPFPYSPMVYIDGSMIKFN